MKNNKTGARKKHHLSLLYVLDQLLFLIQLKSLHSHQLDLADVWASLLYNYIKMPKRQVEFGMSHFDCIPKELVCEIMIRMPLEDRLSFLGAYPRFLKLAQSSALRTRVLTYSDRLTERRDLEKVLDPEGTRIQVSSLSMNHHWHYLNCKCNPLLDPDVFHLMPKLQVIIFKDCELRPSK